MKVKIFISPKMNFFFDLLPAIMQNRLVLILYMYLVLHIIYYPYKKLQITNDMTLKKKTNTKAHSFLYVISSLFLMTHENDTTMIKTSHIC